MSRIHQCLLFLSVQIAELVATEFFEQGDKERRELNIEPSVSAFFHRWVYFVPNLFWFLNIPQFFHLIEKKKIK